MIPITLAAFPSAREALLAAVTALHPNF